MEVSSVVPPTGSGGGKEGRQSQTSEHAHKAPAQQPDDNDPHNGSGRNNRSSPRDAYGVRQAPYEFL